MSEKDRKEFKEKQSVLLLEAFQNEVKLENLKPQFFDNINRGTLLYINPTVDSVKKCLKKKETAKVKFRALLFLKECMDTKNKAMGAYVQSKILSRLKEFAKLSKKPSEKVKAFTKDSDNQSIENFFQLLLECLNEWQVMFPIEPGTQRDPSQFKKVQSELLEFGIRFPQKKVFFSANKRPSESAPPLLTNQQKPQLQKISSNPKESPPTKVLQVKSTEQKAQTNPNQKEILAQARDLRDGSLNYFGILLECLGDVENCQVIIEMAPDLQSLITPIDEHFVNKMMSLPPELVEDKMLEEIFQIRSIAEEIIKDINKVQKKNSLFPQLQKKYTAVLNKFIKSTEQVSKAQPSSPLRPKLIQQEQPVQSEVQTKKSMDGSQRIQQSEVEQKQLTEDQQKNSQSEAQLKIKNKKFQIKENTEQSQVNPPVFQADFGSYGFQQQDKKPSGFQADEFNGFQQQDQNPPGFQADEFNGFQQQDQTPPGFQTDFGFNGFQQQDKNPSGFQSDQFNGFQPQDEKPGFQNDGFNDFQQQNKNAQPFQPDFGFNDFQKQDKAGFQEPWNTNPEQDPYQGQNYSIEHQQGNEFALKKTESFTPQNYEYDFALQLANTTSKNQSPLTPQTSQIRSQGQPFSNIFEIENTQKQIQERQDFQDKSQNRGLDSASELGNLSHIPQDKNMQFGFDDFQDFNLHNINSSVASQKQISQFSQKHNESYEQTQGVELGRKNVKKSQSFHDMTKEIKQDQKDKQEQDNFYSRDQEETPYLRKPEYIKSLEQQNIPQVANLKTFVNFGTVEVQHDNQYSESFPSQKSFPLQDNTDQVMKQNKVKGLDPQVIPQTQTPTLTTIMNTTSPLRILPPEKKDFSQQRKVSVQSIGLQADFLITDIPTPVIPRQEIEIQVICKQDPDQEINHQQERRMLMDEIRHLKTQNQTLQNQNQSQLQELKTSQINDQFVKSRHQQISTNYVSVLSQFSDASEKLNKSRINLQALHHQLYDSESQNKILREQLTEQIKQNQDLRENGSEYQNKYNGLLKALSLLVKVKCSSEPCSVTKYLTQMLANNKQELFVEPEIIKLLSPKKKPQLDASTRQIEMDYNVFMRIYRVANSQLENIKYACLMQRGVIFENQHIQFGVITKYHFNEQIQSNELIIQLNLYNKTNASISINDAQLECPSNNYKNDPLDIKIKLNPKQSSKQILPFTYSDNVQMPILTINVNQEPYKIILPVLMTKFCIFQQCDQNHFMQTWKIMKEEKCQIISALVERPNQRLIRDIRDIRRYWHDIVEIRSKSNKINWIGLGLIGKINNLHQIAIKFVKHRGLLSFKISTSKQLESQGEYLLQTLLFLFNQ